jgi:hypothetical protein
VQYPPLKLQKPFQPAQVFREKFPTLTVFDLSKFLKVNFPHRLLNDYTSEYLISHLFDHFKMRNRTISPYNNNTYVNMLEKLFSIFNYGFPCFLMNENSKQLETVRKKIPEIIETILINNKKHFRKLIHKHINFDNKFFNYIHNQIMTKIFEQAQTNNVIFIFIPKTIICPKTNILYFRPQLILFFFTFNYLHVIKNKNYVLLRRILEADVFNSFPNFQQSLLIRKYMEAFLLNNLERKMHKETENLRQFLI